MLSNLYMRRFVKGWKTGGHERRLVARIVNYADDFVICCRGTAEEAMVVMRRMMSKLKLVVNETKTRLCSLPAGSVDFLGYTFGRSFSYRTRRAYLGASPSRKKIAKLCDAISADYGFAPTTPIDVGIPKFVEWFRWWRGRPAV